MNRILLLVLFIHNLNCLIQLINKVSGERMMGKFSSAALLAAGTACLVLPGIQVLSFTHGMPSIKISDRLFLVQLMIN